MSFDPASLGALCTGIAAVLTAWRSGANAKKARAASEAVKHQTTPTNGTRVAEYIERIDGRMERIEEMLVPLVRHAADHSIHGVRVPGA